MGSLRHSTVQELICKDEFLLLLSHEIALKRVYWINLQRRKRTECCKIAIRNAGMKQDDIARLLNVSQSVVSRPLKEHRESGSITKEKRYTLILECKELLLKHYGTWCII